MNSQLIVRMDKSQKERFERMTRRQGQTASEVIRAMVDEYVVRHDMQGYLNKLIDEIGVTFTHENISQKDIDRSIKDVRAGMIAQSKKSPAKVNARRH